MRAIIIDDDQYAIDRILGLLDDIEGIEIINTYTEPIKAIENLSKETPDLIFTDVEMPQMSGLELAKEINNTGLNPKIIFITAFDHYAIKAIKEQAFDYLLKPVDIDELKNTIDRLNGNVNTKKSKIEKISKTFFLSQREKEILLCLFNGMKSSDIANELFISKHTVDTHRRKILEKTGCSSSQELIGKYLD